MHEAGVPILCGTDCGSVLSVNVYPGFSIADELELLVSCGLSARDALHSATLGPAQYFGETARIGTVAEGKVADLVLLEGNPLEEISSVRKIAGVMRQGKWMSRSDLDAMLRDIVSSADRRQQ
jgi:imidazolonepropionase-like amidohydrolase